MFKEVNMTVTSETSEGTVVRVYLMDEDKALRAQADLEAYRQSGAPKRGLLEYEDSGGTDHMHGLAGSTELVFESITDIAIAPDPLGP